MKEVEFINSQLKQGRSQHQQGRSNDYSPKTKQNAGASEVETKKPSRLIMEERKSFSSVLRNFMDALSIYRLTLDNHRAHSKEIEIDHENDELLIKLRKDTLDVDIFLDELIDEIETNGCYDVLMREIEEDEKRRENEIAVTKKYDETLKNVADLRKMLEDEKKANSREREELKAKLFRTKNEKMKLQVKVNIETKYVKAREEARRESNALRYSINIKTLEDEIEDIILKEKNEHRVAADIAKFLDKNIKENEREIAQWEERYEREMLMCEKENERLSKEIKNRRETLAKLQLEHRERQEFMDTYIAEKEAAEKLQKHEEHRRDCAVRIQSWWRGVMVRRKLGPYRPDERKKKRSVKSKK